MNPSFKVCIRSYTFNHSNYILDALNGFVMQKTDFPFVSIIVDDASTDESPQIISTYLYNNFDAYNSNIAYREETNYGVVLFARHRTNFNCFFAVVLLKENHYSQKKSKLPYLRRWIDGVPYVAICEGDDYWTDPEKLKKQVSFMDNNPDYSMCSHQFYTYNQSRAVFNDFRDYLNFKKLGQSYCFHYDLNNYFKGWYCQPLTCLYRNGDYLDKIPVSSYNFYRDRVFFYYVLRQGKGAMLKDVMGVYRVHNDGVWSRNSESRQAYESVQVAFEIYQIEKDERALIMAHRREVDRFYWLVAEGNIIEIVKDLFLYIRRVPIKYSIRLFKRLAKDRMKRINSK